MYSGDNGNTSGGSSNFENEFMNKMRSQPAPVQNQPKKGAPRWVFPVVVVFGLVILIVAIILIVVFGSKPSTSGGDDVDTDNITSQEFYDNAYDETGDAEVLNDDYKAIALKNPNANYMTEVVSTPYAELSPKAVCGALGIDVSDIRMAGSSTHFREIEAINSNALDYYLDGGKVVVMAATRDVRGIYLIYARSGSFYHVYAPDITNEVLLLTRTELFNDVVDVPDFYVLEEV